MKVEEINVKCCQKKDKMQTILRGKLVKSEQ